MNVHLHDFIGIVGSAMIVVTYLLVQLRRMQVTDVIEGFWLLISCIGLIQFLRERLWR
jgi:hypothetical protein